MALVWTCGYKIQFRTNSRHAGLFFGGRTRQYLHAGSFGGGGFPRGELVEISGTLYINTGTFSFYKISTVGI